jgi:hypothetical protein
MSLAVLIQVIHGPEGLKIDGAPEQAPITSVAFLFQIKVVTIWTLIGTTSL